MAQALLDVRPEFQKHVRSGIPDQAERAVDDGVTSAARAFRQPGVGDKSGPVPAAKTRQCESLAAAVGMADQDLPERGRPTCPDAALRAHRVTRIFAKRVIES